MMEEELRTAIDKMLSDGSKSENLEIHTSYLFEVKAKHMMTFDGITVVYNPSMPANTFNVVDRSTVR